MKRTIIRIDEEKCNGCGQCVTNCPEGALKVINGKARLVGELLCDGLGACIGHCPQAAILIEEREAKEYDERAVMDNVIKAGIDVITAHLEHLRGHGQHEYFRQAADYLKEKGLALPALATDHHHGRGGNCPGSMMREFKRPAPSTESAINATSQLSQWPVQLKLLNPHAPYFKNADLLIAADCVPFAYANFHEKFLAGKGSSSSAQSSITPAKSTSKNSPRSSKTTISIPLPSSTWKSPVVSGPCNSSKRRSPRQAGISRSLTRRSASKAK